jgi:hypothetical protein
VQRPLVVEHLTENLALAVHPEEVRLVEDQHEEGLEEGLWGVVLLQEALAGLAMVCTETPQV